MAGNDVIVDTVDDDSFVDESVVDDEDNLFAENSATEESDHANNVDVVPSDSINNNNHKDLKSAETKKGKAKTAKTVRGYGGGGAKANNVQKKKIQCTVENCQYSTPYAKDLARHMRKHTGEKPYQCRVCPKAFSRHDKLKMHMMTHEGVKPYECDLCSYATVDPGSLRKHRRTHTNERPYKCQLCPYQGKDSSQLVVHLRHHTGDTPYSCMHSTCTAAFKTPSDLQRHIRLHTGEKPYKCPYCDYRATVKCNLNTHVRKIHKDDVQGNSATDQVTSNSDCSISALESKLFVESCIDSKEIPYRSTETAQLCSISVPANSETYNEEQVAGDSSNQIEQAESSINNVKKSVDIPLKTTTSRKKFSISADTVLPFQYACKACPAKCDNYNEFAKHMKIAHSNILRVSKTVQSMIVNKVKRHVFKPEVPKLFQCPSCAASFAREDSLRCHVRQHTKSTSLALPPNLTTSKMESISNSATFLSPNESANITALLPGAGGSSSELPLLMHSRTAVIDGQTQNVYVIMRHETSTNSTTN